MKNLTIGKKIALGFTSVLCLTVILGLGGVLQLKNVDTGLMDLAEVHIPIMNSISEIDASATNQNLQVSLYAIHKEEAQLEEFAAMDEAVDQAFEDAKEIINTDEELVGFGWLNKVEEIAQEHDVFVSSCRSFIG